MSARFTETPADDLVGIKPLTTSERKWCEDLAALLGRAPKRLALYTIGDAWLGVVDKAAESKAERETGHGCEDGYAERLGFGLGYAKGRIVIHGVSG